MIEVDDIRVFVPSKDYAISKSFYQKLVIRVDDVSDHLCFVVNGNVFFFLQDFYNKELAINLMLQLSVVSIDDAYDVISHLEGFGINYEPIKIEHWGKVNYLWGPSGELLHVTEFNH
jgi:hypothetical protein